MIDTTPRFTKDLAQKRLIVEKDFQAPVDRVWGAWSNDRALSRWWGPQGWPATSHGFDFRVGGRWHFCLTGPGDQRHWGLLRYTHIEAKKALHAEDYSSDPTGAPGTLLSRWEVEFRRTSAQTTRVVTQVVCSSTEGLETLVKAGFEAGFTSALENLTEALTGRGTPQTVRSADGTTIVYEKLGSGPPVILVGGAMVTRDNPTHTELAAALSAHHTVYNYDRRGRGDSGDTNPYAVEREVEDLAALVALAGGRASVYGLSSGAILALHALGRGVGIARLVVWEAPFVVEASDRRPPSDALEALGGLVAQGRRGAAVHYFMTRVFGMPAPIAWLMRLSPYWKDLMRVAPTLPYDLTITGDFSIPESAASVKVPVLVLHGDHTQPLLVHGAQALARTIPGAELKVLPGVNHQVAVADLAPVVLEFLARDEG